MRRWLCLLLALLALSGCGLLADDRVNASASEMTGTWIDAKSGLTIALRESKDFEASDVAPLFAGCPGCLPSDLGGTTIKGTGTWSVGPPTGRSGPANYVHLLITKVDNTQLSQYVPSDRTIRIEKDKDKGLYLAFYRGDPDLKDKMIFQKQ